MPECLITGDRLCRIRLNQLLLQLPPYNPELNLIEKLISSTNSNELDNRGFETGEDVKRVLTTAWQDVVGDISRVKSVLSPQQASIKLEQSGTINGMSTPDEAISTVKT